MTSDDQGAMSRYRRLSQVPGFADRKPECWAGTVEWPEMPARVDADGMDVTIAGGRCAQLRSASPMPRLAYRVGPAPLAPASRGPVPTSASVYPARRDPHGVSRRRTNPDPWSPAIGATSPSVVTGLPNKARPRCASSNLDPGRRRSGADIGPLCPSLRRTDKSCKDCRRDEPGGVPHNDLPSPARDAKQLPAFDSPFLKAGQPRHGPPWRNG